jgi:predicted RNA binding protein YcfA (HicA-like mRNA interferase family)
MEGLVLRGTQRAADVFKALDKAGWTMARIAGSHRIFTKAGRRCLPIAVHNGMLRRDVVRAVIRQAGLTVPTVPDAELEAPTSEPTPAPRPIAPAMRPCAQRQPQEQHVAQAEATEEDMAEHRTKTMQAEEARQLEQLRFRERLDVLQLALVEGEFASVEAALAPELGRGWDETCQLHSYESIADALFFYATALSSLAIAGGAGAFGSQQQQQQITRAFEASRRLYLEVQTHRDEAAALLSSLLTWMHQTYVGELLTLAASQQIEEFNDGNVDTMSPAMRSHLMEKLGQETDFCGRRVRLIGLKARPALNGVCGTIERFVDEKGRFQVNVDGEKLLLKRGNLSVIDEATGQQTDLEVKPLLGGASDRLDRLNESLLSGFGFIIRLSRSEKYSALVSSAAHTQIVWPVEGIHGLARAAIIHYERGHLAEGAAMFEELKFVCEQHQVSRGLNPIAELMSTECPHRDWTGDVRRTGKTETRALGNSGKKRAWARQQRIRQHQARYGGDDECSRQPVYAHACRSRACSQGAALDSRVRLS